MKLLALLCASFCTFVLFVISEASNCPQKTEIIGEKCYLFSDRNFKTHGQAKQFCARRKM